VLSINGKQKYEQTYSNDIEVF